MNISELLLAEFRREAEMTRKVLERVPSDHFSWKPHAKSMSLGQLALHTAGMIGGVAELFDARIREVPVVPLPEATSVDEILTTLKQQTAVAESKLIAWGEAGLQETVRITNQGATMLEAPRYILVRSILFNHWVHHRAQLTVYLRMLDVPVPALYGPSADEM
ncbi:MAG: DinB family protein [Paenibacillaceae bacterium]|jgi:uncharacterized damage-inducible protein DinB|nr:DinB family protein [Paenibacillaceae bacterium]